MSIARPARRQSCAADAFFSPCEPSAAADGMSRWSAIRTRGRRADRQEPRGVGARGPRAARLPRGRTARASCRSGCRRHLWNRRSSAPNRPWPPAGPFDVALLRLPKAKDEQEMAAHACLGVLAPGGRLIVYGGNDEGIRSAGAMLERLCGAVETLATRGHGRVRLGAASGRLAPDCAPRWRTGARSCRSTSAAQPRDWSPIPGCSPPGASTRARRLLIERAAAAARGRRRARLRLRRGRDRRQRWPREPAIDARHVGRRWSRWKPPRENVPGARLILGRRLADAGAGPLRRHPVQPAAASRDLPRTTQCSSSSFPERRAPQGRRAACRSWCSDACPSSGCFQSTLLPWGSRPRPRAIGFGAQSGPASPLTTEPAMSGA